MKAVWLDFDFQMMSRTVTVFTVSLFSKKWGLRFAKTSATTTAQQEIFLTLCRDILQVIIIFKIKKDKDFFSLLSFSHSFFAALKADRFIWLSKSFVFCFASFCSRQNCRYFLGIFVCRPPSEKVSLLTFKCCVTIGLEPKNPDQKAIQP